MLASDVQQHESAMHIPFLLDLLNILSVSILEMQEFHFFKACLLYSQVGHRRTFFNNRTKGKESPMSVCAFTQNKKVV